MNEHLVSEVLQREVKGMNRRALIVLATEADAQGYVTMTTRDTAWKLGVSQRSIQRSLVALEELGALKPYAGTCGSKHTYQIDPNALKLKEEPSRWRRQAQRSGVHDGDGEEEE